MESFSDGCGTGEDEYEHMMVKEKHAWSQALENASRHIKDLLREDKQRMDLAIGLRSKSSA